MIAFLLSILASLALESPIVVVEKVIFGVKRNSNTQTTMADETQTHASAPSVSVRV